MSAEAALRVSEARYRDLYEHIPLMYFTLDGEGTVLSVNRHGAEELGYTAEELVGQPVLAVFHEEDREAVGRQLEAAVASPGKTASWEFRKIRKDGSLLWVQEAVRTISGADGRPVVLVACEDVTAHKEIEEQLVEQRAQLRSLTVQASLAEERERRRLSTVLHDRVGQTLAMAKLKLGQLLQSQPSLRDSSQAEEILAYLERALGDTRKLTFDLASPILHELGLEAALRSLLERLGDHDGIRSQLEIGDPTEALSDDLKIFLYRSVRELVHNVVKHAAASHVTVFLGMVGDSVRIRVEDDGVGFDAADAGSSFSAGGGFGLFSVREGVELLGGRLELDSTAAGGTRVTVTVPIANEGDSA
jgi:PAS domain S-box-containing protein